MPRDSRVGMLCEKNSIYLAVCDWVDWCRTLDTWSSAASYQLSLELWSALPDRQAGISPGQNAAVPGFADCPAIATLCCLLQYSAWLQYQSNWRLSTQGLHWIEPNNSTQLKGLHTSRKTQQLTLLKGLKSCPLPNSCNHFQYNQWQIHLHNSKEETLWIDINKLTLTDVFKLFSCYWK